MFVIRPVVVILALVTLTSPSALAGVPVSSSDVGETVTTSLAVEVEEDGPSGSLTPGRMGLYESALMPKAGHGAWSSLDLGLQRFDYSLTDNVQLGVSALLPIGILAVMPEVKVGFEVAENLHLAATARAGVLLGPTDEPVFTFGGNAMVTYGTADSHLTAGIHAYAVPVPGLDGDVVWAVHPSFGGVLRVAEFALLHLDLGPIFAGKAGHAGPPEISADIWAIKYGVRFHGDNWFGDVAFVVPASEDWGTVARILPLGIPALSFGYAF